MASSKGKSKKGKTAKQKREEQQQFVKDALQKRLSHAKGKDVLNTVGFVAAAYIIKEGVFDPFKKIFDINVFEPGDAGPFDLNVFDLFGPLQVRKVLEFGIAFHELPAKLGEKLGKEIAERIGLINDSDKTDEQKQRERERVLDWAKAKAELEGWLFGFAGAWALGKFLSETTITELAEALDTFIPLT